MLVSDLEWTEDSYGEGESTLHTAKLPDGDRLTVLERTTGFSFHPFDIETGYKDTSDKFWLASGNVDIREYPEFSIEQAVEWVKFKANTCVGD